jgi:hypothetical protein
MEKESKQIFKTHESAYRFIKLQNETGKLRIKPVYVDTPKYGKLCLWAEVERDIMCNYKNSLLEKLWKIKGLKRTDLLTKSNPNNTYDLIISVNGKYITSYLDIDTPEEFHIILDLIFNLLRKGK